MAIKYKLIYSNYKNLFIIYFLISLTIILINCEHVRELEVSESVPIGHQIGYIGEFIHSIDSGPPYLIVPVPGSAVDNDLSIDHTTGEIRTKVQLDRETRSSYSLVAIPLSGENVRVIVRVLDENDNPPTFPTKLMFIEFPENTPRDVKRTLNPARDLDLGRYNTQRYNIISGNIDNAFRLSSHRERDGVLYLDLQINGFLDRETIPSYILVIEALDGGSPPLRGQMTVNITIQDVNDNQPIFNQSRYFATIPENATIGTNVLKVYATDTDAYENGLINYSINRRQSDKENMFRIDSKTGLISVNKLLDFETKELHELVVVAKDNGEQPLETTAFVSIRVTDVNDNQPIINVIFLSDDATPKISENAQPGEFVARISVNDPDSKTEYSNVNVTLNGGDGHFGLTTRDNIIYLVIVSLPLDREIQPNYTLSVIATDNGNPPLHAAKTINLKVTDINDNIPEFEKDIYYANVMEIADPGTSVLQINAIDHDEGNNSVIIYKLIDTPDTHSQWFQIDKYTGLITTKGHIDCETEPIPQLTVIAKDTGYPPLSSTATVLVTIHDVNDNEPIFDQSFYNVSVAENEPIGRCILKVSASDPDCGINAMVNYTLDESIKKLNEFEVRSASGEICISGDLDYETRNSYEFPVIATDRGGLSTTAMVKIQLNDINDNRPIFYPREYNVSLREMINIASTSTPVVAVVATDPDSGRFGTVSYRIVAGNEAGIFRIERNTGEIFINRPNMLSSRSQSIHILNISASDGGGLRSLLDAEIFISIIDSTQRPPIFEKSRYNYYVKEDVPRGTVVGAVLATNSESGSRGILRYSIYSGDPDGYFSIDQMSGNIRIANPLDHETKPQVLLNIQATSGDPPAYGHTQVNIDIEDVNDNPPEFESNTVRISIPENVELDTPLYAANAKDKDSEKSNTITYTLTMIGSSINGRSSISKTMGSENVLPSSLSGSTSLVIPKTSTSLLSHLNGDLTDGISSKSSFSIPLKLTNTNNENQRSGSGYLPDLFTIDSRSGHLTLSRHLDYETSQRHSLIVTATDSGEPPLSANLTILVEVQDVNDNPPVFERNEYSIKVLESMPINSQILQVTAIDLDTGNNARLTYRIVGNDQILSSYNSRKMDINGASKSKIQPSNNIDNDKIAVSTRRPSRYQNINENDGITLNDHETTDLFGIFPNSGWIYLRGILDRETNDRYELTVIASDNGTPSLQAKTRVIVNILDANDNDPRFSRDSYDFLVEENQRRGAIVGTISAIDLDMDANAAIRYSLIPANTSFQINPVTGEITTREPLDRETRSFYDLVAEARDQGIPSRSARVPVKIIITDINDNAPDIVDPQEDVVSVREEQPPGTDVVKIRAIDRDNGSNATITYSILKGRDSDGFGIFSIDPITGLIRTRVILDHEERSIYRLAVAATDGGKPQKQTIRLLRVEVLDLNDNRPTFTSSSLVFRVREDVPIGYVVGSVGPSEHSDAENLISTSMGLHITYTLTSLTNDIIEGAFEMDRQTGSLVVARRLDREQQAEYRLEIRALDTTSSNNPQSSAITVKVEIADVNDNPPKWNDDPIIIYVSESTLIGQPIYNFTANDADSGTNGDIQYHLVKHTPNTDIKIFSLDSLTGTLTLLTPLDYETINEYILIVQAIDQSSNISERLHTSVTARLLVIDSNDNTPIIVSPSADTQIIISDILKVNENVAHIVAIDKDDGDNGRITYGIHSGNEDGRFKLDPETGFIILAKPFYNIQHQQIDINDHNYHDLNFNKFNLLISASDHGTPVPKESRLNLQILVESITNNPPRFLEPVYHVNISENLPSGSFVVRVGAKSFRGSDTDNLTFEIPPGVADNHFIVDGQRGIIKTNGQLDRETKDHYTFPIYVFETNKLNSVDGLTNGKFDVATIVIKITDINDHGPEFHIGSCYSLSVPENSEFSIIHTVVASDLDEGVNGEIIYSIIGGNVGNKFNIDMHTGELTARPLDRELNSRYLLQIQAQDRGTPIAYHGNCNISVIVEDQNDNDPRFELSKYIVNIPEDIEIGASILKVHAIDADHGINARIVYSLANETQWLFSIDNRSGLITTVGKLDREKEHVYNFMVVATDGGRYDARSQSVSVQIIVDDVNDNKPVFEKYPFKGQVPVHVQPGQTILKISATDSDYGTNGEIVYSLINDSTGGKFRINPNTGSVSVTQNLANENGNILHLEIMARDKGNPPQTAIGLIEMNIGDIQTNLPSLKFPNDTYYVKLLENTQPGKSILTINAVRSDGRRQKIIYSFGNGNEDDTFSIDSITGEIKVKNSKNLDYEKYTQQQINNNNNNNISNNNIRINKNDNYQKLNEHIKLIIVARTDTIPILYGYTEIKIELLDENDNGPHFTQQQYSSVVWEGNNKGTYVMKIAAYDADNGINSRLLYHIVDGNHDNAFIIEPAFSGIVKTNIVLDREIRDSYRLKVIATDEGVPQMTGTATIRIKIVDINDNQPTFPPHSIISVSEGTDLGTVLTTISANDVDTSPTITYRFSDDIIDLKDTKFFAIDRYSGKVILKKKLDYELQKEYQLKIIASDTAHEVKTNLIVRVIDINDNPPVFQQPSYFINLPDTITNTDIDLINVNAIDADSLINSKIQYKISPDVPGYKINNLSGMITVNTSRLNRTIKNDQYLTIIASDSGNPVLNTKVIVKIHGSGSCNGQIQFLQSHFKTTIKEDIDIGKIVVNLIPDILEKELPQNYNFLIISGNDDENFEIFQSKSIILVKKLDRELIDHYNLRLIVADRNTKLNFDLINNKTIINIFITIDDINDNQPIFQTNNYNIEISETSPIRYSITKILANDSDLENSQNSEIEYDITSGNDDNNFLIDINSGIIIVNNDLDYDLGKNNYNLIIRACDKGYIKKCSLKLINIKLTDENDNEPNFPVNEYIEYIGENEPIGTNIFIPHATDIDKGKYGKLNYTIESINGYSDIDESWKLFNIDHEYGIITSNTIFDYEQRNRYNFLLKATDIGNKFAAVRVKIMIESRDEYSPQFTERTYHFTINNQILSNIQSGYIIGYVSATDRDKGPDGRIVYQLNSPNNYFKINRTTGAIIIKKNLDNDFDIGHDINLVITASSGRQGSLTNMTVVEITLDQLNDLSINLASTNGNSNNINTTQNGIADWALGLLISLLLIIFSFAAVFLFLHIRNRRHKHITKPNLSNDNIGNSNSYVDPSAFDTIPIRGNTNNVVVSGSSVNNSNNVNQFPPPKYDEIPPYGVHGTSSNSGGGGTTSELSGSEQSGSSGRGSAEDDGEDEEIRMINEGPLHHSDHHCVDDINRLSDISVQNTQEYLARLGIVDNSNTIGGTSTSSRHCSDSIGGSNKDTLLHHQLPIDTLHNLFDDSHNNDNDITNLIYAKLNDVNGGSGGVGGGGGPGSSDRASSTDEITTTAGSISAVVDHVIGFGDVPVVCNGNQGPSMNGSLSSIVHSEEELTGSYNWDYLLDWGPQYQPLAHVFSEIARLKDDTLSIHSGNSGTSSAKSKQSIQHNNKHIPPPLLTNIAPRSINIPVLSNRNHNINNNNNNNNNNHHQTTTNQYHLPRSPISHDTSAGFGTSSAMSPSFSPSLSPLATRSPSISPHVVSSSSHHMVSLPRHHQQQTTTQRNKQLDSELRVRL